MHKIVYKIHEFLESAARGNVTVDPLLLDDFGERCKAALKKQLEPEEKEFRLRMSNIGRPLRQLMLEQKYGRSTPSPEFLLKMLFGDLYESLMLFLLKSSGIKVTEQDKEVSIPIKTKKGIVNLEGKLDVCLEVDGEEGVYDIKSASPYSFDNKFDGTTILDGDDAFGYVDQLFAYAKAVRKKAKGWLPINKASGEIKVNEVPPEMHDRIMSASMDKIAEKVCHVVEGKPIPECSGVIDETFYGKPTGNKVLGPECRWCSHKDKCHPNIQYRPALNSKAKDPDWKWYTFIKENNK